MRLPSVLIAIGVVALIAWLGAHGSVAYAFRYNVTSQADLENAIQNASGGDEIVFTEPGVYSLCNLSAYANFNDNGQFLYPSTGQWEFRGISIVVRAEAGVDVTLMGCSDQSRILLNRADGSVISGLRLKDLSVEIMDSTGVTISGNSFLYDADNNLISMLIISGTSTDYVVQGNSFENGGMFIKEDASAGTAPGAVSGNIVNGKPLVYKEGDCGTITGPAGQVVLYNCRSGQVSGVDMSGDTLVAYPLLVYGSSGVTISGFASPQDSREIIILRSTGIVIRDSRFNNTVVRFSGSQDTQFLDNNLTVLVPDPTIRNLLTIDATKNMVVEGNRFNDPLGKPIIVLGNVDGLVIRKNQLNTTTFAIDFNDAQGTISVYLNLFYFTDAGGEPVERPMEITGDTTTVGNESFRSPMPVIYTYNDQVYNKYLGNYYSIYTGTDADGDGIGDTAFPLDFNGLAYDNHPIADPIIVLQEMGLAPPPPAPEE